MAEFILLSPQDEARIRRLNILHKRATGLRLRKFEFFAKIHLVDVISKQIAKSYDGHFKLLTYLTQIKTNSYENLIGIDKAIKWFDSLELLTLKVLKWE